MPQNGKKDGLPPIVTVTEVFRVDAMSDISFIFAWLILILSFPVIKRNHGKRPVATLILFLAWTALISIVIWESFYRISSAPPPPPRPTVYPPPSPPLTTPSPSELPPLPRPPPPAASELPAPSQAPPSPGDIFSIYADRFARLPHFRLPAPAPSATAVLPQSAFVPRPANLFELHERILKALNECGYFENAFYYVPRGFALVTRIEQIDDEGSPLDERRRWDINLSAGMHEWTLAQYLRVLFLAPRRRYRVIVFIVSPGDYPRSEVMISSDEAMKWFSLGPSYLPNVYELISFSNDYRVTALIYEFYVRGRTSNNKDANLVRPSHLLGDDHLAKSHISAALAATKER
jgi:hypothetical protein